VSTSPQTIDYKGSFTLPGSPEQIWSALARFDRYESWWSWLTDFHVEGAGLATGSVLHGTVAPPLPYRMRIEVTLVRCVPHRSIQASVAGDLQGTASLLLRSAGAETKTDVAWTIEMMQRRLRLVARVARPLLLWGHDRVVATTVARFRELLRAAHDP
jgi:uncharacterized protein YndB with AHSA1/START domain